MAIPHLSFKAASTKPPAEASATPSRRPSYQTAAGVLPISKNDGSVRRGLPDVAGMVGMDGFFFNGSGGPGTNQLFGTSAVSPLYAGLVAVINAFLGRNVGFP